MITAAVDFADVITAMAVVGGALGGFFAYRLGLRMVLGFVSGDGGELREVTGEDNAEMWRGLGE